MYAASKIRNFAIAGHSGSGKTALCDLMLFKAKAVDRLGATEQKTSVSDYTNDEHDKMSSIYATPLNCEWNGNRLFFIDTPGYGEFIGEVISSLAACDNALMVIDGVQGIEVGTTRAWKLARERQRPRIVFINRLDRDNADFFRVLSQVQDAYGKTVCIPITMPVGKEGGFSGVVHVLRSKEVPDELAEQVADYRERLMDTIAESDEELMMRYLDGEELTEDEMAEGLHKAILAGDLVPVFAGSASKDIGVTELMNAAVNLFPPPNAFESVPLDEGEIIISEDGDGVARVFKSVVDPFIGQLTFFRVVSGIIKSDSEVYNINRGGKERFGSIMLVNGKSQQSTDAAGLGAIGAIAKLKNTHISDTLATADSAKALPLIKFPKPVMSYAITAVKSGEEDKIVGGLNRIAESDATVKINRTKETHETLLSGMGDQHLNNVVKKLKETAKVDIELHTPKIPYRETITAGGDGHYRHKKQTGGSGQFAEVFLRLAPCEDGYEFENAVVGGSIPRNFIPAVEKGVVEAMINGPLAGCTVENLKVSVYDGKHHPVDSNEMAFKIAGRMAFRDAMQKASPILLEPVMNVKIMIPDEYMGDISGDLNHKRGRILGMGAEDGMQVVNAEVPLAEMARYATELRSMTQGRGLFEMEFARYEMVPSNVAKEIIDKFNAEKEEG